MRPFLRSLLAVSLTFLVAASAPASISSPYASEARFAIAPGVFADRGTIVTTTAGRQAVYLLEIDVTQSLLSFEASLSNDRVSGLETTTAQANRKNVEGHRAVAGINSDFWDTVSSQAPNGLHVQDGELMTDGGAARPTFGVRPTRALLLAGADVNTTVVRPDGITRVARKVNQPRGSGDLVIYTARFAGSTGTSAAGTEVVLTDVILPLRPAASFSGIVGQVRTGFGNTPIGAGDVILSGAGAAATFLDALSVGQTVTFTTAITAGWEDVVHASGGGQWIVQGGAISIVPHDPGFADVTHPRSAIGFTAAGDVILAVVDGRQPGYSVGVRLDELAELMISRGAVTAANLDGGGSSTMAIRLTGEDGVTQVNRGSDGYERSVSNSLLLFSSAPTGPLAIATLFPSNASLFVGSGTGYTVRGQDATYNKVAIDPASVSWSLSASGIGAIDMAGRFTSTAAGSGNVLATIGAVVGSTPVTVLDTLSALAVKPNPAVVQPDGQQLFSLRGTSAVGSDVVVDNHVASWSASGPIGTIDATGLLTASSGGSGTVTASAGGASGSAHVDIGRLPEILEDFEDITDMRAQWARATATLTTAARPNPVRFGTTSGRLSYNFTGQTPGTSAAYAAHLPPYRAISDRPLRIGVWVYGDGSRHWLRGNYRDGTGGQKVIDFTAAPTPAPITKANCATRSRGIDWIGWKYVEAPIPADALLPLRWERVYLAETADLCDNVSTVYFDDLRAVYSNTSEDLVGPEVSNVFPAPGKRVYTSAPEIGGTVIDPGNGSGVAPESIRLTVDGGQVNATFDPVSGIVRYVPTTPLADGTHTVGLEAEDRAGNPALPFGAWSFVVYTGPDVEAPVVDRAQPLSGTTSKAGRPRLSARIVDEYRGLEPASIEMRLDGNVVPAIWDEAAGVLWYAPTAPLSDGAHTVAVRAGDRESPSNVANASWSFTVSALAQPAAAFRFTWMADGGYFEGTKETAATAILGAHLAREAAAPPSVLVFGGDIVENDQQVNFDRAVATLASVPAPALVAAGNHEISGSLSRDRFWRTFGPTIAAVDYGPVDFLILDSASSSLAWDPTQFDWLESELARSDAGTVFVVLHVPTRDPFGSSHGLPASEGARLESILAAAKAAAASRDIIVLSGDVHAYGRWARDGVHYLISGGAGGGLDAVPAAGGFYHRLHVSVDPAGAATIAVIPLLESAAVAPAEVSLLGGQTQTFAADGDFFTSTNPDIVLPIADPFDRVWSSADPATVAVLDSRNGVFEAWVPGETTIAVASGGATGTATVTVTATLASVKALLERAFAEGAVQHGVYTSLLSKLNEAEAGAPGALRAFINELRAVRGETVAPAWADRLIANAEYAAR